MVDQRYRDAAYRQETDEAFVVFLLIEHPSIPEPGGVLRLTDHAGAWLPDPGVQGLLVDGAVWMSAPIEIEPPGQTDDEPRARVRIPNVDQRIGEALAGLGSPASCMVRVALASDPDVTVGGPYPRLRLATVQGDAMMIEGSLTWPSLTTAPWPRQWVRPGKYRAAFRS